jgi:hypothetical protein
MHKLIKASVPMVLDPFGNRFASDLLIICEG